MSRKLVLTVKVRSKLWLYPGPGGWHFITLPKKQAAEIRRLFRGVPRGWGSVRVTATIGTTTWKTSLFPEAKSKSYVLPVKADVRKKEAIGEGDMVGLKLDVPF
ncbi:MAG TPA: DUF1905 domain-containing protein [Bacteroidota bacterium]